MIRDWSPEQVSACIVDVLNAFIPCSCLAGASPLRFEQYLATHLLLFGISHPAMMPWTCRLQSGWVIYSWNSTGTSF